MPTRRPSPSSLLGWLAVVTACGNGQLDSAGSTAAGGDVELGRNGPWGDGDADADADADADEDDDAGGDACGMCGQRSCGAQLATCMGNAECSALGDCGARCEDDACYQACEEAHPAGTTDLFAYYDCLDTRCAADCGGADPEQGADPEADPEPDPEADPQDPVDPDGGPASPCDTCVMDFCAGPDEACYQNAACVAIFDCSAGCADDEECYYFCEDQNPAGLDDYYALMDCVYYECQAVCGM